MLILLIPFIVMIYLLIQSKKYKNNEIINESLRNDYFEQLKNLSPAQAEEIYNRNKFGNFIFKNFPGIIRWEPCGEDPGKIDAYFDGTYIIKLIFCDNKYCKVPINVNNGIISVLKKEEIKKDLTQIVDEWMENWKDRVAEFYSIGIPFDLPKSDFPPENGAINMIVDQLSLSGNFSAQVNEHCVRFIPE